MRDAENRNSEVFRMKRILDAPGAGKRHPFPVSFAEHTRTFIDDCAPDGIETSRSEAQHHLRPHDCDLRLKQWSPGVM
jgi:hypothetical protein